MLIQDAIRAAAEDGRSGGKARFAIARRSWSLSGKELRRGPALRVTASPDCCIYYDEAGAQHPRFPLSGADLLADDWYILWPYSPNTHINAAHQQLGHMP